MDNASKALIMAGGILIGVMVIGIAMYILSTARGFASDVNDQLEANAIESYNRYYQSFGGTIGGAPIQIEGIDVLNIYNKAVDDNWRADSNIALHYIDITGISTYLVGNDEGPGLLNNPGGIAYMQKNPGKIYTYKYSDVDGDGYIDKISIN